MAIDLSRLVASTEDRVVAVELDKATGSARLFKRLEDGTLTSLTKPFHPFVLVRGEALANSLEAKTSCEPLDFPGEKQYLVSFENLDTYEKALEHLKTLTGFNASAPLAPYRVFSDMTQQMLTALSIRLFRGMAFKDIRRMQLDIETRCAPGHTFSDAITPEDEVILVSLKDTTGFEICLSNKQEGGEAPLLKKMISLIRLHDPDVIEGHNIYNFDLSYLEKRCKRYKIPFAIGRDGVVCAARPSRFTAGERTLNYRRFDIYGRHIIDTYFLVTLYDIAHRDLDSHGLKYCAKYFGVAAPNRTYVDGGDISRVYDEAPETLSDYCLDDVRETAELSAILLPSYFYQTQLVPYSFQNCIVRGNATRIDALLCAEYLTLRRGLPMPEAPQAIQGALSVSEQTGIFHNVWHMDIRSLYPSIIISERLTPRSDPAGVFLRCLETLRMFRLEAKDAMRAAEGAERDFLDALQSSFKILINSFYGYTAFSQGSFNDYQMAARITSRGREILTAMRDFLESRGAVIIEMDTDGIYFSPSQEDAASESALKAAVQSVLPPGIEVDLDATYPTMFAYKSKNYALLDKNNTTHIAGAALKSRGLEPFQRRFIREIIDLYLHDKADQLDALYQKYCEDIQNHALPLADFVQREVLSVSPDTYAAKRVKGETSRSAAYELALKATRSYKQGDTIPFYIIGDKKKVVVAESCKLADEITPDSPRDENTAYYLEKLRLLKGKF